MKKNLKELIVLILLKILSVVLHTVSLGIPKLIKIINNKINQLEAPTPTKEA